MPAGLISAWRSGPKVPAADSERRFELALRRAVGPGVRVAGRVDADVHIEAVVCASALRTGVDYHEVVEACPGVDPATLLAAYRGLRRVMRASLRAWDRLSAAPSETTLNRYAPAAARVLPVPTSQVAWSVFHHGEEPAVLAREVASVRRRIDEVTKAVTLLEESGCAPRDLFDGLRGGGAWTDPWFRPDRVAQLVPLRVLDLLDARMAAVWGL